MKRVSGVFAVIVTLGLLSGAAIAPSFAAEPAAHPPKQEWSFEGIFGTYDRGALQRGFQVYQQVCAACHGLDLLSYRNLEGIGYDDAQVKAIAAQYMVTDGPNDEGEMFERPALPSDRFVNPYPNAKAAAFVNNGAVPPDMSLIVHARHGGADYIHAILTGYEDAPEGTELLQGQYWNKYKAGNVISMAPPLADGMVGYEDGTQTTLDQYARDVSTFLAWASDPHMEARKQVGVKAFLFLLVFTCVMYAVKRKIWHGAH